MTVTCPEGHRSEATDYCDTCGAPIAAATPSAVGGDSGGVPGSILDLDPAEQVATVTCPHCGGVNVADALFCEACGYDFTTGSPPLDDEPAPVVEEPEVEEPDGGDFSLEEPLFDEPEIEDTEVEKPGTDEPGTDEPEANEDALEVDEPDVAAAQDIIHDKHDQPDKPDPEPLAADGDEHGPEPSEEDEAPDEPDPQPEPAPPADEDVPAPAVPTPPPARVATPAHARPRHTPPSRALADAWVVEVWVDPDWYAVQQTEEACPSAGVPDIVVVRRNVVLVGRPSGSLSVRPDVDAGADSAVSRRHAQLTSDGRRWWIEDLGSSNGSYVGVVGDPLPTAPVTPGVRVEIDRDDRIYVGAWTRLVIRQATASEQAGQG